MIILVDVKTDLIKVVISNASTIQMYSDCVYIDNEKHYGINSDNVKMYRVENLPNDVTNGEYYYNGYKLYKKSSMSVTKGFKTRKRNR